MSSMTKEQFSQLVVRYERLVYTICFQLVRDTAAAEDLTQETFLSAYLHRDAMPEGYERQWLVRIAANKAKDYLQSAWNRRTGWGGGGGGGWWWGGGGGGGGVWWGGWGGRGGGSSRRVLWGCGWRTGRCAGCASWRRNPRRRRLWPWAGR